MYRLGVYPGHDAALRPEPSGARRTASRRLPVPLSTNVLLHPVALPPCRPASSTPRPCVAPVPTSHRSGRRSVFSQWQGSKQGRPLSHTGVSRSDFELGRVLGRGSFGTVALATKTSRGSQPRRAPKRLRGPVSLPPSRAASDARGGGLMSSVVSEPLDLVRLSLDERIVVSRPIPAPRTSRRARAKRAVAPPGQAPRGPRPSGQAACLRSAPEHGARRRGGDGDHCGDGRGDLRGDHQDLQASVRHAICARRRSHPDLTTVAHELSSCREQWFSRSWHAHSTAYEESAPGNALRVRFVLFVLYTCALPALVSSSAESQ